jgi:3-hydroxyisobutyrate dehydrogenase-like beta-hydroxyacid dehydrogenase
MTQERVGFIGLGTMGRPMAQRLLAAGYPLQVWNRSAEKVLPLLDQGAKAFRSPAALAAESTVIITMVSDPDAVKAVLFGADGVADGLKPGSVVIDMSTVAPATSRDCAAQIAAKQAEFLDAPVLGSVGPAAEGTLAILVGGLPTTLERVQPILQCLGKTLYAGGIGKGSVLKLTANLILAHLAVGFAEAVLLLEAAGGDVQRLFDAVAAAAFRSPWFQGKGRSMVAGDFRPQFAWKHMHKDIRLMLDLAREQHADLPTTHLIETLYAAGAARFNELDFSAILAALHGGEAPQPPPSGIIA